MIYEPFIPYKQCTKCHEWKKATLEYWHKQKAGLLQLRSDCRICRNSRDKSYRESHKEERKSYRESHKDEIKSYRESRKEERKPYDKSYYESHKDEIKSYRESRKKERKEYASTWQKNNLNKFRSYGAKRRALKRNLPANWDDTMQLKALEYWDYKCAYCGVSLLQPHIFGDTKIHWDHFIPLNDSRKDNPGTVMSNMLPTCRKHNLSKNDLEPIKWINDTFGQWKSVRILNKIQKYFNTVTTQKANSIDDHEID